MNHLHVDSVIKSFGTKQVMTDIYLTCKAGEIVGLLGRNGSGKSTLLKIIFGAMEAERKFVKIGDKLINGLSDNRNLVSYLPQDHFLPNHIRVTQMISLLCDRENAALIKEQELVKGMLGKKSSQLSGGEHRFLEILLIVHSISKYILLDEPFNGVAPIYKEIIKTQISQQSHDKGFIITDHDYRNILDISTRIVLMHDGGTKPIDDLVDLKRWGYIPEV